MSRKNSRAPVSAVALPLQYFKFSCNTLLEGLIYASYQKSQNDGQGHDPILDWPTTVSLLPSTLALLPQRIPVISASTRILSWNGL